MMPEVGGKVSGSIGAEPQVEPALIHLTSLAVPPPATLPFAIVACFPPSAALFIPLTGAASPEGPDPCFPPPSLFLGPVKEVGSRGQKHGHLLSLNRSTFTCCRKS